MHYRRLGSAGIKVSEISLGSWITFGSQIDEKAADTLVHAAFEQGVNFFDNADVYADGQAEVVMGKAIKSLPREQLVLSSKVFWPTMEGPNGRGLSRKHIMESVKASLKRMDVEYFDLYFCHRYDPDTPVEEVVRAMSDLVQRGYILYWGTSEWRAAQIVNAIGTARRYNLVPPTMDQPQYSMFHRTRFEEELAPLAKEFGIKDIPQPAGGCILTELDFGKKLKELMAKRPDFSGNDAQIMRFGRVVWEDKTLFVVARDENECEKLKEFAKAGDWLAEPQNFPGPTVLVRDFGKAMPPEAVEALAKKYVLRYSKKLPSQPEISVKNI